MYKKPKLTTFLCYLDAISNVGLPLMRELAGSGLRERFFLFNTCSPSVTAAPCHLPRQREADRLPSATEEKEIDNIESKRAAYVHISFFPIFCSDVINDLRLPLMRELAAKRSEGEIFSLLNRFFRKRHKNFQQHPDCKS